MAHYAKTRIDAGKDKDGKQRVFDVGQEVSGLGDEELKQLRDAGSLADHAPREGEPGYQAAPDEERDRVLREREEAQRTAAGAGTLHTPSRQAPNADPNQPQSGREQGGQPANTTSGANAGQTGNVPNGDNTTGGKRR